MISQNPTNVHPLFEAFKPLIKKCHDCYSGEDAIKLSGTEYLPMTSTQKSDAVNGVDAYNAYKKRAVFHEIFSDAIDAAIGIMHREPPTIQLPSSMEPMRENCTLLAEPMEMVLRKINTMQLVSGRIGLLADIKNDGGSGRPVLVTYNASACLNWDDRSSDSNDVDLRFVVLDESRYEIGSNMTWQHKNYYRVLGLSNDFGDISNSGIYGSAVVEDTTSMIGVKLDPPNYTGIKLPRIPFCFINSIDLSATPAKPPLLGLANLCLAIYRLEADYRQNLFMQGQDTLVRVGSHRDEDEPVHVGAGNVIDVPQGGDAKYIGVSSTGLPEQRMAIENDYNRARQMSAQIMQNSSGQESGEAIKLRQSAQAATLPQIAMAGAAGFQKVLRDIAVWMGSNPDEVIVKPNLKFSDEEFDAQILKTLTESKRLGLKISDESIHRYMQEKGLTQFSHEDELELMQNEPPGLV